MIIPKIRIERDLFGDPNWPLFYAEKRPRPSDSTLTLSALSLLTEKQGASHDLKRMAEAGSEELARILYRTRTFSGYRTFLFVADGPWQPRSAVVMHNKLWGRFAKHWDITAFPHKTPELAFESEKGIRYAGLLEVSEATVGTAVEVVRSDTACALIVTDQPNVEARASISRLFESAFPRREGGPQTFVDWPSLCATHCPLGFFIGRVTGSFDDPFVAIDLIASDAQISTLTREVLEEKNGEGSGA